MQKVEGSVLWLLKSNKWAEQNLKREAEARGISAERLIFAEKVPQAEHLARQKLADLFLDTFNSTLIRLRVMHFGQGCQLSQNWVRGLRHVWLAAYWQRLG